MGRGGHIQANNRSPFTPLLMKMMDENNDTSIDFEEFYEGVKYELKSVWDIIDPLDGGFDNLVFYDQWNFQKIHIEVFARIAIKIYSLLDTYQLGEYVSSHYGIDAISFLENRFNANISAPLEKILKALDNNKNDKLDVREVSKFVLAQAEIFDENKDCFVTMDEIMAALEGLGLPLKHQIALRLLGEYYLTLTQSMLKILAKGFDKYDTRGVHYRTALDTEDSAFLNTFMEVFGLFAGSPPPISWYLTSDRSIDVAAMWKSIFDNWLNRTINFDANTSYHEDCRVEFYTG